MLFSALFSILASLCILMQTNSFYFGLQTKLSNIPIPTSGTLNDNENDDPRLKEFIEGKSTSTWRGTRTMLERRGEQPNSKYTPTDVIRIVLAALSSNDYPQLDHGSLVVLEFRSPHGPLSLISNPAELGSYFRKSYSNLVDFKEAKLVGESISVQSDFSTEAIKQAIQIQPWGSPSPEEYNFFLSRHNEMWLIDAIAKA